MVLNFSGQIFEFILIRRHVALKVWLLRGVDLQSRIRLFIFQLLAIVTEGIACQLLLHLTKACSSQQDCFVFKINAQFQFDSKLQNCIRDL